MTKLEMAQKLHEKTGIEKHDCIAVVEALFGDPSSALIATALVGGEEVSIPGFGVFSRRYVKGKVGTTPWGDKYTTQDHHLPVFRAAQGLKDRVAV